MASLSAHYASVLLDVQDGGFPVCTIPRQGLLTGSLAIYSAEGVRLCAVGIRCT